MTQVKLGDENIPFIYQGDELLYPNPVKDGLVLWYDFKGIKNDDFNKEIAEDLSGNKNNGTLQNFAYTNDSGYNNGLKFDNVDDILSLDVPMGYSFTLSMTLEVNPNIPVQFFCGGNYAMFYVRKLSEDLHVSITVDTTQGVKQVTTFGGNAFFSNLFENNKRKFQVSITVDKTKKEMTLYGNGVFLSNRTFVEELISVNLNKLGRWLNSNNLDGKIFSTQLYNRALTEQEIKYNYQLEKERWGL